MSITVITTILNNIILAIPIFFVLILIHEFGHFIAARLIGVKVEEFGFGLPPRIWGKKKGKRGTVYSINWLPFGGFVKLAGEDESENSLPKLKNAKEYFFSRSKKERAAILLAGVTMNFLLAVGITTYALTQGVQEPAGRVHIDQVLTASPAQKAGLKEQDIIEGFKTPQDLIAFAKTHAGQAVTFTILRGNKKMQVIVTPRKVYPKGDGPVGIAISDMETRVYPLFQAPWVAIKMNVQLAWEMLAGIGGLFVKLFHMQSVSQDVAGPIAIVKIIGQTAKFGWRAVLDLTRILSLELAIINVLPIPAMDGGRLAFVFLEKILGRRVKPLFEQSTHQIGMIVLIFLIIIISINDILRGIHGG